MMSSETFYILFVMAVIFSPASFLEDKNNHSPSCKQNNLDKGIKCSAIGKTFIPQGYDQMGLQYMPLASAYFVSRLADSLGYNECCQTKTTLLKELDIVCLWSGYSAASSDTTGSCSYSSCSLNKVFPERCTMPTPSFPHWLCKWSAGYPGTSREKFGPIAYKAILESINPFWTVFINCFDPKTPQNPNAKETATAFSVFSLDPVLPRADRKRIIRELNNRGFNTSSSNIIEFDYKTTKCTCNTFS